MPDRSTVAFLEERVEGAGGLKLNLRSWRPSNPKAVVVICHGVNSHGGQYVWAAEQLATADYSVYALDLRGRGKSDGERFYVETVTDYVRDVATAINVAKSRERALPVFLLGHSAGGVVSCTYALDYQSQIKGLICESFAFEVPAPNFALAILKGLSRVLPRFGALKLKNADFSRDPAVVAALESDPLIANEVQPAITVAALVRADERLRREFSRITLPVFILHGSDDRATKPSGSRFFFDTVGSRDKTLKIYDGHYHDLLADYGKEAVLADMKAWLDQRV